MTQREREREPLRNVVGERWVISVYVSLYSCYKPARYAIRVSISDTGPNGASTRQPTVRKLVSRELCSVLNSLRSEA